MVSVRRGGVAVSCWGAGLAGEGAGAGSTQQPHRPYRARGCRRVCLFWGAGVSS